MSREQSSQNAAHGFRTDEKSPLAIPRFFINGCRGYLDHRKELDQLQGYCMFVGYPRSGHSLVGSLINAHPEAVVAHETNLLRYLRYGFPRQVLLGILLHRDREFGTRGRSGSGYDYRVTDQYQGRFTRLRVIGDKRGRASTKLLGEDPELLRKLKQRLRLPLRVIHHVRNPFDNIATMARRAGEPVERAAYRYFRLVEWATTSFQTLSAGELVTSHHEDFVGNPRNELARLIRFLDLEPPEDYLDACTRLVFDSPRRSRDQYEWSPATAEFVERTMAQYPHLQRYCSGTGSASRAGPPTRTSCESQGLQDS